MSQDYLALIQELKRTLKSRKLTYRELGRSLGMSEAGVKRIFRSQDGKISTIAKVCDALGFSLADLMEASKLGRSEITIFSEEQESYFIRNFDAYIIFNELVIRKKPLAEIRLVHGLNEVEMNRYLKALEKIGIVERGKRLRILMREPIGFQTGGALGKLVQEKFVATVSKRLIASSSSKRLFTREWLMSPESLREFTACVEELIRRYDQVSARDHALLTPEKLTAVSLQCGWLLEESPYGKVRKSD